MRKEIMVGLIVGFVLGLPSGAYFFYQQNAWASDLQFVQKSFEDWRLEQIIEDLEWYDELEAKDELTPRDEARQKKLEREYERLIQ